MYLHLGQSVVVPYDEVIGLFDLDNCTSSHITRAYLNRAEREGSLESVTDDLPKSFVVCARKGGGQKVYLSQLSAATLLRRAESNSFE